MSRFSSLMNFWIFFRLCPQYVLRLRPQLKSTCHYTVNHYVKILHVLLGGSNNIRPLSGGWGHKRKRSEFQILNSFKQWAFLMTHFSSTKKEFETCLKQNNVEPKQKQKMSPTFIIGLSLSVSSFFEINLSL